MEAEEYRIAAAFLERASELDPENANFRYMALHALEKANSKSAIQTAQVILENWERNHPRLVLKATRYPNPINSSRSGKSPARGAEIIHSDYQGFDLSV